MKKNEKGLYDIGTVELEETDSMQLSPELEAAQAVYCASWPIILTYLTYKISTIKKPVWKIFANIGLSIFDSLHTAICNK